MTEQEKQAASQRAEAERIVRVDPRMFDGISNGVLNLNMYKRKGTE